MKYLVNIDLNGNQLVSPVIHTLTNAPSSPNEGQIYFNSTSNKLCLFANGSWQELTDSSTTGVTKINGSEHIEVSNNGTGTVDISTKDVITKITGTDGINSSTSEGQASITHDTGNSWKHLPDVTSVTANQIVTWNGTAACWADAPATGVQSVSAGGYINITGTSSAPIINHNSTSSQAAGAYKIGHDEYGHVVIGDPLATVASTGNYNDLSNIPDLSEYQTINNMTNGDLNTSNTNYPSNNTVKTYVDTEISKLAGGVIFKGTLGIGGTITSLPTASADNKGYMYKVITAGTYAGQSTKIGDLFVSSGNSATSGTAQGWYYIPSGDEPSGTVTSVAVNTATGLFTDTENNAITTSGTISHSNEEGFKHVPAGGGQNGRVLIYNWNSSAQTGNPSWFSFENGSGIVPKVNSTNNSVSFDIKTSSTTINIGDTSIELEDCTNTGLKNVRAWLSASGEPVVVGINYNTTNGKITAYIDKAIDEDVDIYYDYE